MKVRNIIRAIVYGLFPSGWIRAVQNSLVPGHYQEIVRNVELVTDLQRSSETLDNDYRAQKLRQYAHIVDKGLQRFDCEPGHSFRWYQLAQETLSQISDSTFLQDPSVTWATQIIRKYERLQCGEHAARRSEPEFEIACEYGRLVDTIKTRRSIRFYSKRTVDLDVIEKIVEVINWSPTSCNRQTAKVFVTNDPSLVRSCLATCQGATGFSEFVPCFLCFCADLRPYAMPQEIWLPVLDVSLGIQNCCLVAHTLGLSTTLLSWAQHSDEDERELRHLLGIPNYYQIVVNGALGYPECSAPVPLRKSVESAYELR